MRKVFFLLFLIFSRHGLAGLQAQTEVRTLYQKAATEEESCQKLLTLLKPFNESNNALLTGYKACATMMMANYVSNPFSKLSRFLKGKKLLEKAIQADRENAELRFLRFTVQTNAPSFLGYRHATNEDKLFLIKSVAFLTDTNLKQMITSFLVKSNHLTPGEKQRL
jgi:hypothetical protein